MGSKEHPGGRPPGTRRDVLRVLFTLGDREYVVEEENGFLAVRLSGDATVANGYWTDEAVDRWRPLGVPIPGLVDAVTAALRTAYGLSVTLPDGVTVAPPEWVYPRIADGRIRTAERKYPWDNQ